MARIDGQPKLEGTQEILFAENGECLARIVSMGQAHLQGAYTMVEAGQSVSWLHLGLTLVLAGLAVLVSNDDLCEEQLKTIYHEVIATSEAHVEAMDSAELPDIPF